MLTKIAFKEKVIQKSNARELEDFNIRLELPYLGINQELKGVIRVHHYFLDEYESWKNYLDATDHTPSEFANFKSMAEEIVSETQEAIEQSDSAYYLNRIEGFVNHLAGNGYIPANSDWVTFLQHLYQEDPRHFKVGWKYLTNTISGALTSSQLDIYLRAYEFKYPKVFSVRAGDEMATFESARQSMNDSLAESEQLLTDHISRTKKSFETHSEEITRLKDEKQEAYSKWFSETTSGLDTYISEQSSRMQEIEALYREKLKIEAPAAYWNTRAKSLKKEGNWWLAGFLALTSASIGCLIYIMGLLADGVVDKIFDSTANAIKYSILFLAIMSFMAYGIKLLSKMTFSTYHLSRDAQEREQLTYVYLAMLESKGIDANERHLIMQSLFSRVDTGLLKDDGSPTMPGSILDKVVK